MEGERERPNLTELKERIGHLHGKVEKREFLSCKNVFGGVPRGVLCEVSGSARTAWLLDFLIENPTHSTFWAEEKLTILPTAIHQRGIRLPQILFAETGEDKLFQTIRKALRENIFSFLVLPGSIVETKLLKSLQLLAREKDRCVIFLSKSPKTAWAIPFQVRADWCPGGKSYEVEILKSKFSQTGGI